MMQGRKRCNFCGFGWNNGSLVLPSIGWVLDLTEQPLPLPWMQNSLVRAFGLLWMGWALPFLSSHKMLQIFSCRGCPFPISSQGLQSVEDSPTERGNRGSLMTVPSKLQQGSCLCKQWRPTQMGHFWRMVSFGQELAARRHFLSLGWHWASASINT